MFMLKRQPEDARQAARPWVAEQGADRSYVASCCKARVYATREDAERDRCGNEAIIDMRTMRSYS